MIRKTLKARPKRSSAGLAVSVLALYLAACGVAAPQRAGAEAPATPPPAAAPVAASPAALPALIATEGVISTVEVDGTVIIMAAQRKGVVVYVKPETKVVRNGKAAGIRDLKVGDHAVARHGPGGAAVELTAEGI